MPWVKVIPIESQRAKVIKRLRDSRVHVRVEPDGTILVMVGKKHADWLRKRFDSALIARVIFIGKE